MADQGSGKVVVIGVGDDGLSALSESSRQTLANAEMILGSERELTFVEDFGCEKAPVGADMNALVKRIEENIGKKRTVVLAAGDPLFYGVTRYLFDRIGKEHFEVVPHVSSMQLAFARVMESWDEAYLTDVANHSLETIIDRVRVAEKAGIFTNQTITPTHICQALLAENIDYFTVYVCENLGTRNEVVTQGSVEEMADHEFSALNVMVLIRRPDTPDRQHLRERKLFGNPDDAFKQSRPKQGLLTPSEVRTIALAQLHVHPEAVVWDVGAGSGSVSVEAALLAHHGRVCAVEPDQEDCELIRANAESFGVGNVTVHSKRAPEVFSELPDPLCVFIGGTGRETIGIVQQAFERLIPGGNLVCNVASLENVSAATSVLKPLVPHVGLLMVNISRGNHQLESIRFEALNPSFLVYATKPN